MKSIKTGILTLSLSVFLICSAAAFGQQSATPAATAAVVPGTPSIRGLAGLAQPKPAAVAPKAAVAAGAYGEVTSTGAPAGTPMFGTVAESAGAALAMGKMGKMGKEGIDVHGHWTITVRNPDGSVAQHREFENSLNVTGGTFLIGLLSGQLTAGNFMIALQPGASGACVGATYAFCGLTGSTTTAPGSLYCASDYTCNTTGLTVTPSYGTGALTGPFTLTLAGSITANNTGTITGVATIMSACGATSYPAGSNPTAPSTTIPTACQAATGSNVASGPLTSTNITAVPVTSGQLIEVQVVISFS